MPFARYIGSTHTGSPSARELIKSKNLNVHATRFENNRTRPRVLGDLPVLSSISK